MNEAVNMSLSESKVLIEKINQENKEINAKIAKVLRSKTDARKYEKELNDHPDLCTEKNKLKFVATHKDLCNGDLKQEIINAVDKANVGRSS